MSGNPLPADPPRFVGVVCVHAGAGTHDMRQRRGLNSVLKRACVEAVRRGGTVLEVIEEAIRCLEDSPLTNAGLGSSLSLAGHAECDASIIDGSSGRVGSVLPFSAAAAAAAATSAAAATTDTATTDATTYV
jgi:taspase (threonine aspartase 1)